MAGNVKFNSNSLGTSGNIVAVEFDWTGDSVTGTVPNTPFALGQLGIQGYVFSNVKISSDTPAPTSGYTVQVLDAIGIDVLEGQGIGVTASGVSIGVSSSISPLFGGVTIAISGNAVAGAKGRILIFFRAISLTQMVTAATSSIASSSGSSGENTSLYDWSRTPLSTQALTIGVPATVSISPMPAGINGQSVNKHYVSVITASTHKAYLITAVGAGSITFTPGASHGAGTWTLHAASGGIQEAIYATSVESFFVPEGTIQYDALRVWNPRKVTLTGAGMWATIIRFSEATANGFLSESYAISVNNMRFEPITGSQTAGVCVGIIGTLVQSNGEGDVNVTGCQFYRMWDCARCDWPGGFLRASNNYFREVQNRALFTKATSGAALQYVNNYFDGRTSTGLIQVEGILAGGVISSNWMQASLAHIVIQAVTAVVNELLIGLNILDQDSASTAVAVVNGAAAFGSNCIKFSDNYLRTEGYGILVQDCDAVIIDDNRVMLMGAFPAFVIAGSVSAKDIDITDNRVRMFGTALYAIQLSNPAVTNVSISGNKAQLESGGSCTAMIGIASALVAVQIQNNQAGTGIPKLIDNVSATGAGTAMVSGNQAYNQPTQTLNAAATITLPLSDEAQPIGITATAVTITEMNGVSARSGCRRTFIVDGAVSWNTSSAANNKIGRAYGPTVAGQVVEFVKYSDNMWYPISA